MAPTPDSVKHYHVFVASPGDVDDERQAVRAYFAAYNRSYAEPRGFRFDVIDWQNYSTAGAGRPQALITDQTLEHYRPSLALVIGIMAQRFGSPSGTHESGTEEEFEWARGNVRSGFPELKWFFREIAELTLDPKNAAAGLAQWQRVQAFRERIAAETSVYSRSYATIDEFKAVLDQDLGRWLNDAQRPWFNFGAATVPVSDWSADTLARLARRLNDDFVRHMSAGEDLSSSEARTRYIPSLIRRRPGVSAAAAAAGGSLNDEGPLADFVSSDGAQLLVIGPGGSGKTTLLRQLAAAGASRATEEPAAPVFVYARLTSFDRGEGAFDALLDLLSLAAQLDRADFENRWQSGTRPMVVLLDGLNEVAASYRSSCTRALWTLLQNSAPCHRYVITSRPGGELESMATTSTDHRQLRVADVLAFDPAQVRQYFEAQGRAELHERLSVQLRGLASNPFLLWAITRTLGESPHIKNRGTLFSALIDGYIFEKREQGKPTPRPTSYNYRVVKQPVLARLALTMIEGGVTDIAEGPELYRGVAKQLLALEEANARALALEAETFMPRDFSGEGLVREIVDNGVLVREGERLRFMHESVEEYFAAFALRDADPEAIAARVRPLNLARLGARGPTFEMLVTWAGLAPQEAVVRLVTQLRDTHLLLAAHIAVEAGLPEDRLRILREQFVSLASSVHEQRRRLAAMGLAVVPSDDPTVVACLVGLLDSGNDTLASSALHARMTRSTIAAVLSTWLAGDGPVDDARARFVRNAFPAHSRLIAEALIDAWQSHDGRRDRVALIASTMDRPSKWYERIPRIRKTLTELSTEADVTGHGARSATIDDLRRAIETASAGAPTEDLETLGQQIAGRMKAVALALKEGERLRASYAALSDAALEALLESGRPREQRAALDTLVKRGAPIAVRSVVDSALDDTALASTDLEALQSLPRQAVRALLAERVATLTGPSLRHAEVLLELVSDTPSILVLARVLDEEAETLRAGAAAAAARGGAPGVELLLRHLEREDSGRVIEAALKSLGTSSNPRASTALLDLLFDDNARSHWPTRWESNIEDADTPLRVGIDGWASALHDALQTLGEEGRVLDRVAQLLVPERTDNDGDAVHEARRWLPAPRAVSLLRQAAAGAHPNTRRLARWSLAAAGDPGAWRLLLDAALDARRDELYVRDAARRLAALPLEASVERQFASTSESALRPALVDPDEERRAFAVDFTARLPRHWVDAAWRGDALAAADQLVRSTDPETRVQALQSMNRLDHDWRGTGLRLLTSDPEASVASAAFRLLGEAARTHLDTLLRQAFQAADPTGARALALRIKDLFAEDERQFAVDLALQALDSPTADVVLAGLLAICALFPDDEEDADVDAIARLARGALERGGVEEMWGRFAVHGALFDATQRNFIYRVLDAFESDPDRHFTLASLAHILWPDDALIAARHLLLVIPREEPVRAMEAVRSLEARFPHEINPAWLAERFEDLGLNDDALRLFRAAADAGPDQPTSHVKVGWLTFLNGDLNASIESTRRALELEPTMANAEFNLGLALLAQRDGAGADAAYRRGLALTKRDEPADALERLDDVIRDLDRFAPDADPVRAARIRASLVAERDRLIAVIGDTPTGPAETEVR